MFRLLFNTYPLKFFIIFNKNFNLFSHHLILSKEKKDFFVWQKGIINQIIEKIVYVRSDDKKQKRTI